MDGIVAFGAQSLGATSTAVDAHDNPAFRIARDLLGLPVKYCPHLQIADLRDNFDDGSFDVIVCAGVIYHMLMPMEAFTSPRKLLRHGGYLVMETPFNHAENRAILSFNGIEESVKEPLTYFVPSQRALQGMAILSGFKLIATRILSSPRRITQLFKAVSRDELIEDPNTSKFMVQMLKRDTCDNEFRFHQLEQNPVASASVSIKEVEEFREIIGEEEVVNWPFHPPKDKPTYGVTRWETKSGNTKVL